MDANAQAGVKDQISKLQREIKMLRQQLRQPGAEQSPGAAPKPSAARAKKAVRPPRVIPPKLHTPNAVTPEAQVPAKYNDWPLGVDPTLYCYRYIVGFKIFAPSMPNQPVASIEDLPRYPVTLNPLILTGEIITPELYDIIESLNTAEARMTAIRQHPDAHLSLRSTDLVIWSVEFGAAEDGTEPKIYVRTETAWYLLLDPEPEYQPLFRELFDKCMLVQNLLDALVSEPRLSLTGPLNRFGIDFNQVKQHSAFLLHHIKSLNDEKINNSVLVQELTRMAPPPQPVQPILPPGFYIPPQSAQQPLPTAVPAAVPVASSMAGKRPHQVTPVSGHSASGPMHDTTLVPQEPKRQFKPVYNTGTVSHTINNTNVLGAVPESKFNPASLPATGYQPTPYQSTYAQGPPVYPPIKLKTQFDGATNGHNQHVPPTHTASHTHVETHEQVEQSDHDATRDELDFEHGFDLESVFVDSQDEHPTDGSSNYFSLS